MAEANVHAPNFLQQYVPSPNVLVKHKSLNLSRNPQIPMSPEKETKLGITFGQLYAIATIFLAIGGAWLELNSRLISLEEGRKINADNIFLIRTENVHDHAMILDKLSKTDQTLNRLVGVIQGINDNHVSKY